MGVTLTARPSAAAVSYRGTLWWARIICLSAFGPYVTGSARTEQIAVFASAAWVLLFGWERMLRGRFAPAPVLVLWGAVCAVMLIGTVSRPFDVGFYGAQPPSHALSFMLMPLALIIVTWYWALRVPAVLLIRAVAQLIVACMCANTVISATQFVQGKALAVSFLPRFWDGGQQAVSVASLAGENFRYSGIFNQPSEAGIAYGLALLCLIWLAQRRAIRAPLTVVCAPVLIAGGVMTLSKMFLLGAVPLAVLVVLVTRRSRMKVITSAAAVALAVRLAAGLLPSWPGAAHLSSLIRPASGTVATYGGGRYGAVGTLGPVVADVLRSSPWFGFGAGGLSGAYDSLWVETLVVAGIGGVVMMALVLVVLTYRWLHLRSALERPEWRLAGAALALAAGASLGLPSLTANRACTPVWLILGVLITAQVSSAPPSSRRTSACAQ